MAIVGEGGAASEGSPASLVARCVGITAGCTVATTAAVAALGSAALSGPALVRFLGAVGLVAAVMLPLAVGVTWLFTRALAADLRFVTEGVDAMVREQAWGKGVAVRSRDELGDVALRLDALRRHYLESLERERDARRSAEEADRDKTEFLTSVSHELRNPLNAVVGFTDVLLAEIDGPLNAGQREDLGIIRSAGAHLVSLFNDVLDLSAAASGHLAIDRRPVALGPILAAVGAELRGQRRDRPVEIRVQVGDALPEVHGDPRRLRQVVTNLAANALRYTESGEVRLEAALEAGAVVVRVRDTGSGIAPDDLPLLFAEFGQVGDPDRRRKGTGLGLAISKRLVELHGGTIGVESQVGVGSTFTVRLPVGEGA